MYVIFNIDLDDITRIEIMNRINRIYKANLKLHHYFSSELKELVEKYFPQISDNVFCVLENNDYKTNNKNDCECKSCEDCIIY